MDFIFVPSGKCYVKVLLSDLLYIHARDGQTELVLHDGIVRTSIRLVYFEKRLQRSLCRVHSCYLVALDKVVSFDAAMVELPGVRVPIEKKFMPCIRGRVKILERHSNLANPGNLFVDATGRLNRQ